MKIITNKLLGSLIGFQPHLTWLLANIPDMIVDEDDRTRVEEILEDLNLRYARHSGLVLELCSQSEGLAKDEPEAFCGDGKECNGCDLSKTFCNHKQ